MKKLLFFTLTFLTFPFITQAFQIWHSRFSDLPSVKIRVFANQGDFGKLLKDRNISKQTVDFILRLGSTAGSVLTTAVEYEEAKTEKKASAEKEAKDKLAEELAKSEKEKNAAPGEETKKTVKPSSLEKAKAAQEYLPMAIEAAQNLNKEEGILERISKTITRWRYTINHYPEVPRGSSVKWNVNDIRKELKSKSQNTVYIVILQRKSDIILWEGDLNIDGTYTFTAKQRPDGSYQTALYEGEPTQDKEPKVEAAPTEATAKTGEATKNESSTKAQAKKKEAETAEKA